jgi:hypothetical protein
MEWKHLPYYIEHSALCGKEFRTKIHICDRSLTVINCTMYEYDNNWLCTMLHYTVHVISINQGPFYGISLSMYEVIQNVVLTTGLRPRGANLPGLMHY